ncbi:hypothetical protein [Staphylococcus warneri]|uniref:Uncharacterized protein n=1 Tax=Staphylococcus warneri TaxID=1292 RepID=A0A2T4Q0N5_STAWA|nr:hypothetical protein [Staphylococcus warneri]PTI22618.1 hypothetical protein BU080_11465 [Staphylococcus warneri]PTI51149.1 hypothetical protein BU085_06075 [Staphylococcus warneri]RIN13513.1 hypothetical protein BU086_04610 [Staphylococcus warneri]
MKNENKKVIYYYYDEKSNRRPIDMEINNGYDLMTQQPFIDETIKHNPNLKNNLYALVDGKEFKLH